MNLIDALMSLIARKFEDPTLPNDLAWEASTLELGQGLDVTDLGPVPLEDFLGDESP